MDAWSEMMLFPRRPRNPSHSTLIGASGIGDMNQWSGGYVIDIEYVEAFFPQQSPQSMALALTLNGLEPPDFSGAFSYCELGCGRGLTSLILAAANPDAEFHAVDFNPAHIARA